MAYSLKPEETAPEAIRRVVREEAESATTALRAATGEDRDTAVHEARKSVKKMRAAIRLVAAEMRSAAAKDNRRLRDAGRSLSELRDAAAMIEAIDELAKDGDAESFAPARARFAAKKEAVERGGGIAEAADEIEKVGARVEKWPLDATGFEAFELGLRKSYGAGRKAMRAAEQEHADADFHEWRKRVKDHWYHLRLMQPRLGRPGTAREKQFRTLAETLGDEHNLSVLCAALADDKVAAGVMERLRERQNELRTSALAAGGRLYAATAREFVATIKGWWDAPPAARPRRKMA